MSVIIGWDVGGVHLKAARAEDGRITGAVQLAAPLRAGTEPLVRAFGEATARLGTPDRHVVTMTGELADTFASRSDGVAALAALAARELAGAPVALYAGPAGFVPPEAAAGQAALVASANWHASAALVARRRGAALFVDIGSTTADVVPVAAGAVAAAAYTDAERLAAGELVYTGLVRGFLMAAARRAPFRGAWTSLVNENFASMADVHRILGSLPEDVDLMVTADGREKTRAASIARLARMVGCDAADGDDAAWLALARWFAEMQVRSIADGAMLVLSRTALPAGAPVVGAGIGAGVVREVSRRLGRDHEAFGDLIDAVPEAREAAARAAPAAALALIAEGSRRAAT